jgi:TolB-like protein
MKNLTKFLGIIAIGAVIIVSVVGCATTVPIKSVRESTIKGMGVIKSLGIQDFENKSGVGGTIGAQLSTYLTDTAKRMINGFGKFTVLTPTDPNADGVFFGELRNVASEDSVTQTQSKDKEGNTITITTHIRKVSVAFVYGVKSVRTGAELGTISKQDTAINTSILGPDKLTDVLTLARRIVDSQMKSLETDLLPTFVTTNQKLATETSKDKIVKQKMKDVVNIHLKNGDYDSAIEAYDEIAAEHNSAAAKANANFLRKAISSAAAADAEMAQLDAARTGVVAAAIKNALDSLHSKLPSASVIMVMKQGSSSNLVDDVVDQITTGIVQAGRLRIVDRSSQALIDAEQQFQLSGNVDDNSAINIGRQLGARYALICWISGTGSSRKLNLKVLDIQTAQIVEQNNFDI